MTAPTDVCPDCGGSLTPGDPLGSLLVCARCRQTRVKQGASRVSLMARRDRPAAPSEDAAGEARFVAAFDLSLDFCRRYGLIRVLGHGAAGTVYLAKELATDRSVAVKVLSLAGDAEARERFLLEGRILARIDHPHVVRVHEIGEFSGFPYFVCEYVTGGTLRALLSRALRLDPPRAVRIVQDMLAGLTVFHGQGIVHRDLKPENVLLTGSGSAKIADLGVAKDFRWDGPPLTQAKFLLGTPMYMAPEQITTQKVGPASDLYAVGVMLYEMLAGEPPFTSGNTIELLRQHLQAQPPPLRERAPQVAKPLADLVHRALSKRVEDRPAPAEVFAELLDRISRGLELDSPASGAAAAAELPAPAPPSPEPPCPSGSPSPPPPQSLPAEPPPPRPERARPQVRDSSDPRPGIRWIHAILFVLTIVGLAILLGLHFVAAPAPPTAAAGASPEPGQDARSGLIHEIEIEADTTPVRLTAWPGTTVCPLVLTCAGPVLEVIVEAGPSSVRFPSHRLASGRVRMSRADTGLVEGLNWIDLYGSAGDSRWVALAFRRAPHRMAVAGRTTIGDEALVHDRLLAEMSENLVTWNPDASREFVRRARRDAGDPLLHVGLARIDLAVEEKLTRPFEALEQGADLPRWTDPKKLARAREYLELLRTAMESHPGRWDLWHDLGEVLERCGYHQGARAALDRALAAWPDSPWTWLEMARLERRLSSLGLGRGETHSAQPHRRTAVRALRFALEAHRARRSPSRSWLGVEIESALGALEGTRSRPSPRGSHSAIGSGR